VPHAATDQGRLRFGQLVPTDACLARVAEVLDERRLVGTRVVVEPPSYVGLTVVAQLRARPNASASKLKDDALEALYTYFCPLAGGPEGGGWPFGRPVHVGEVYAVLQRLPDVGLIEDARVYTANPVTGERSREPAQRLELDPNQLVFGYEHKVMVLA
jgi:predicted phage baseplate assembly protein